MLEVDHLVVGAGVTGLAVAWRLATLGREVLVLEQKAVAAGASGGPGERGVRANGRDTRELALMARAYRLWPELAEEIGHPTGYRRTGQLHLTERAEDVPALRAQAAAQSAHGVPSAALEGASLRELEPGLSERVAAAVVCPLDGIADHTGTTAGLAAAARRAGAELREGAGVRELRSSRDRIEVVTEDGERVEATAAVLAANAGTHDLVAPGGIGLPVFAVFPHVLLSRP
ncbi:MAG TPA: FAD-dependent oxidoreductase, partial [Acidimicrobiales bacterium]|nr:FAD-dependent oxidoreductase [Acidimicrobiales bacterium]